MSIRFLGFLILIVGCSAGDSSSPPPPLQPVDSGALSSLRVFFGHQSVGRDILAGIAVVTPGLRIASTDELPDAGGVFIESSLGQNQQPETKDRAFLDTLAGLGAIDLALYKYCYVDIGEGTDPDDLLTRYLATLDEAESLGIRTIPVTLPLTTVEPGWKRWVKSALGRTTQARLNAKRMRFNEQLRARFAGQPIIDLARMESTREDGSRCMIQMDGKSVESLVPAFTYDGGHLNERGRRHVARRFILALRAACP